MFQWFTRCICFGDVCGSLNITILWNSFSLPHSLDNFFFFLSHVSYLWVVSGEEVLLFAGLPLICNLDLPAPPFALSPSWIPKSAVFWKSHDFCLPNSSRNIIHPRLEFLTCSFILTSPLHLVFCFDFFGLKKENYKILLCSCENSSSSWEIHLSTWQILFHLQYFIQSSTNLFF